MRSYRPFDPKQPHDAVRYLRMSGDQQNKRSPDQQTSTISEGLKRNNRPWKTVRTYRDDAKTGRMLRNRPGFGQMIADIKSGRVRVDFILVDTLERFGRNEDLDEIRKQLFRKYGVSVLCADQDFADPNTQHGEVAAMFESYRARSDGRVKRHNVIRGKKDKISRGYWPGSKASFGLQLQLVETEKRGDRTVRHCHLIHDPVTAPIVRSVFVKSRRNPSMGQSALAKWLNGRDDIPSELKPFHPDTVGRWLTNPIYHGELVWAEFSADIIDDVRVLLRNPDDEVIRVPNFCQPIVSKSEFEQVGQFREARRTSPKSTEDDARHRGGMTYKYMLTGLVRCGCCGSSMVPNGSGAYKTKNGEERRYVAYGCPKSVSGNCRNKTRIREEWLRMSVLEMLRKRLFSTEDDSQDWIHELEDLVRVELVRIQGERDDTRPALESELKRLHDSTSGWSQSLANPQLDAHLRQQLEANFARTLQRTAEIEQLLERRDAEKGFVEQLVNRADVLRRLNTLDEVLSDGCPTLCNLMLSMHIESIIANESGNVRMRMCKFGTCPDSINWCELREHEERVLRGTPTSEVTKRRRRVRISTDALDTDASDESLREMAEHVTDPDRFAGMPDSWFWVDEFRMPEKTSWAQDNAAKVLERYLEVQSRTGKKPSANALAKDFGVSRPTILNALDKAQDSSDVKPTKHRRPSVKIKGNSEIEAQIEAMHDAGKLEKDIAKKLGVSRSTITAALKRLYESRGETKPDGRAARHQRKR